MNSEEEFAKCCHVRRVVEEDFSVLEEIYERLESEFLPEGQRDEFEAVLRDQLGHYFVAEVDGRVVGGAGMDGTGEGRIVTFHFCIVDRDLFGRGIGSSLVLARLLSLRPGQEGVQVCLQVTDWSADFYKKLGFQWYEKEEDEEGNRYLHGQRVVYPEEREEMEEDLQVIGATLEINPR